MAGRTLGNIIGSADVLAHLTMQATRLRRLQQVFESVVPPGLKPMCRVANLKSGKVVILAENGASALKIKQLATTMVARLAAELPEITEIEVRVQVGGSSMFRQSGRAGSATETRELSADSAQCLEEFAKALPAKSPLKASLERLLASVKTGPR